MVKGHKPPMRTFVDDVPTPRPEKVHAPDELVPVGDVQYWIKAKFNQYVSLPGAINANFAGWQQLHGAIFAWMNLFDTETQADLILWGLGLREYDPAFGEAAKKAFRTARKRLPEQGQSKSQSK